MSRKYQNPPVIEAVCEFHLMPDVNWDITIPGLLYEKLRTRFPTKGRVVIQENQIVSSPQGVEQQTTNRELVRFLSPDQKTFIQLGEKILTIHCLPPYPTWTNFQPLIQEVFNSFISIVSISDFERIGLRYINKIDLPLDNLNLEEYFLYRPFTGPSLPGRFSNFIIAGLFSYDGDLDLCRIQFSDLHSDSPYGHFIIDLDYFSKTPGSINKDTAIPWIEKAHANLESAFEACITDQLRDKFQEIK